MRGTIPRRFPMGDVCFWHKADVAAEDTTYPFPPAQPVALDIFDISPIEGTSTTHTHFTDNIVRFGLNY